MAFRALGQASRALVLALQPLGQALGFRPGFLAPRLGLWAIGPCLWVRPSGYWARPLGYWARLTSPWTLPPDPLSQAIVLQPKNWAPKEPPGPNTNSSGSRSDNSAVGPQFLAQVRRFGTKNRQNTPFHPIGHCPSGPAYHHSFTWKGKSRAWVLSTIHCLYNNAPFCFTSCNLCIHLSINTFLLQWLPLSLLQWLLKSLVVKIYLLQDMDQGILISIWVRHTKNGSTCSEF